MCETCGCNNEHDAFKMYHAADENSIKNTHVHSRQKDHDHTPDEYSKDRKKIKIETDILSKNNLLAERNRGYLEARKISAFNLVSSPGSGKTTLLESLISRIGSEKKIYVIEGDQQTSLDAQRIEAAGAVALQINTGTGCHLDAHMINHALKELDPDENSVLFIENVGNLVCPALFDLGETKRIVITSVTEGEDKPLKYPGIFQSSQLCILNKTDLLPYLDFNKDMFLENIHKVKPPLQVLETSAKTSIGLEKLAVFILEA
jgi:hydrogenase nickel incorporation protein HypB